MLPISGPIWEYGISFTDDFKVYEFKNGAFNAQLLISFSLNDIIEIAREGNDYVFYLNGTEMRRTTLTESSPLYPHMYDWGFGAQEDQFKFFTTDFGENPEWGGQSNDYYVGLNMLQRGQDGFIEYDYNGGKQHRPGILRK